MTSRNGHIRLAHGGGGQLTDDLLAESILPRVSGVDRGGALVQPLLDAGLLEPGGDDRLALTIDSYVVTPWRFPGGDIGRLAVCGTVNDLSVCGARATGMALSMIVAEGFGQRDLEAICDSIGAAAAEAGVPIITGDTKVVGVGQADGVYLTTAGVGRVPVGRVLHPARIEPGDLVLVSGSVGEHGLAVMLAREMPEVQSALRSDAAPLNDMLETLLDHVGERVVFMRDATRGGLVGVMTDAARDSGLGALLDEAAIPVRPAARHAADMLGLDPLEVANEGKAVLVVRPDAAEAAMQCLRSHPLGRDAAIIGRFESAGEAGQGGCELRTAIGGRRVLCKPYGEELPRIC